MSNTNILTAEMIESANKKIKMLPLDGGDYATVPERVKAFRSVCPEGTITPELLKFDGKVCIFKATISLGDKVLASAHAIEKFDMESEINVSNFLENAETSAVGRALGFLGFIGNSENNTIATADEVVNKGTEKIICKNCGNEIKPYKKADGTVTSAIDIFNSCNGFCVECYRAANHTNQTAQNNNTQQIQKLTPEIAAGFEVKYIEAAKQRPLEGKRLCELTDQQLTNLSMKNMLTEQTKQAIKVIMEG